MNLDNKYRSARETVILSILLLPFFGIVQACAERDSEIFINEDASMSAYLLSSEDVDTLSVEIVKRQFSQSLGFYFEVSSAEKDATSKVSSCTDIKSASEAGLEPIRESEFRAFQYIVARCELAHLIAGLAPAQSSYISALEVDTTLVDELPKDFAFIVSSEERRRVMEDSDLQYWSDAAEIISIEAIGSYEIHVEVAGGSQELVLMAKGDLTGDGQEDAIFLLHNSVEGGTYSNAQVLAVSRNSQDAPLQISQGSAF